ncbi:DegV family protein [soil metagenome]
MAVRVVTDSACDLEPERAADLWVEFVPLKIRFGDEEFADGVDLSVTDFYRRLAASSTLPETAAPPPGAFAQAFRGAADAGADGVVCVNLSSGLSATMQSAQNAARAVADTIAVRVIDSRSITHGLGSQVIAAAEAAREGQGVDDIVALVSAMVPRTRVFGALDTLENLKKGGRIGGAQAMLGQLLSIKPILDISSGTVEAAARARTRKKALRWLAHNVLDQHTVENLAVMHGGASDVENLLELLSPRYNRDAIHVGMIGPTIGTHGGPRVMGITYQVQAQAG